MYITGKMKIFYKGQSIADLKYKSSKNNTVAGAWNAGMGLAKELGATVPDFFYAHYGHGDGFSRFFFGLGLAVASLGTATRLMSWWKALTQNTSR